MQFAFKPASARDWGLRLAGGRPRHAKIMWLLASGVLLPATELGIGLQPAAAVIQAGKLAIIAGSVKGTLAADESPTFRSCCSYPRKKNRLVPFDAASGGRAKLVQICVDLRLIRFVEKIASV